MHAFVLSSCIVVGKGLNIQTGKLFKSMCPSGASLAKT